MKKTTIAMALSVAGLMTTGSAWADVDFSLSGFGTLGVTHSNNKEVDYVASLYPPNGSGLSSSTSFGVDTKAGVQGSLNLGSGLSGILQIVTDHRADNTYSPKVEWANLKYQITQDTYVRAGRVVAPVFMVSDYRNVAYALTPVRQPWDVYSLNPISHLDGADIGTRFAVAGGALSAQLTAGKIKEKLFSADLDGKATMINLNYEIDNSTFRAGYGKYKMDIVVNDPTFPSVMYFDVINSGLASQYLAYPVSNIKLKDVGMSMWGLGYIYDPGTWIVQGEYVRRKSDGTIVQNTAAWYAMAGYRIGKFTPYVSYSKMRSIQPALNSPAKMPAMCDGVPYGASPDCDGLYDATYLINAVDAASNQRVIQSTTSLGVRYDACKNLALKAQYDRISKPGSMADPSTGQFAEPPGGWTANWVNNGKVLNLLTVTLDFLF